MSKNQILKQLGFSDEFIEEAEKFENEIIIENNQSLSNEDSFYEPNELSDLRIMMQGQIAVQDLMLNI